MYPLLLTPPKKRNKRKNPGKQNVKYQKDVLSEIMLKLQQYPNACIISRYVDKRKQHTYFTPHIKTHFRSHASSRLCQVGNNNSNNKFQNQLTSCKQARRTNIDNKTPVGNNLRSSTNCTSRTDIANKKLQVATIKIWNELQQQNRHRKQKKLYLATIKNLELAVQQQQQNRVQSPDMYKTKFQCANN